MTADRDAEMAMRAADREPDYDERLSALEARASREDALTDERNHWIGEAKRYERLYRGALDDKRHWYRKWKAAEGVRDAGH